MSNLNLTKLEFSQDIIKNSGRNITLNGKLRRDKNEVIVLFVDGRTIKSAHVCHLSLGYKTRSSTELCNLILDIPKFPKVAIPLNMEQVVFKEHKGIKYTCVNISEQNTKLASAYWLR